MHLDDLLNASFRNRKLFVDIVFKNKYKIKNKVETQKLYYLVQSVNYSCSIIDNYIVKKNKSSLICNIKIDYTTDYVYDLETEDGTFQAGIGEIIVHNTDSIFIKPKIDMKLNYRDRLIISIQMGIQIGKEITDIIAKYPHDLEYEKTFFPFILAKKKNYIGHKYELDPDKYVEKSMGGVLVKRDVPPAIKAIYHKVVQQLLGRQDLSNVVESICDYISDLLGGRLPITDFLITKSVKDRSAYSKPDSIAHRVLADRIADRDPGSALQSNQRIQYVFIEKIKLKGEAKIIGENIETLDYVDEHKLKVDYLYYLEHYVVSALSSVLKLLINDADKLFDQFIEREKTRQYELRNNLMIKTKKLQKITNFFQPKKLKLNKKKKKIKPEYNLKDAEDIKDDTKNTIKNYYTK